LFHIIAFCVIRTFSQAFNYIYNTANYFSLYISHDSLTSLNAEEARATRVKGSIG